MEIIRTSQRIVLPSPPPTTSNVVPLPARGQNRMQFFNSSSPASQPSLYRPLVVTPVTYRPTVGRENRPPLAYITVPVQRTYSVVYSNPTTTTVHPTVYSNPKTHTVHPADEVVTVDHSPSTSLGRHSNKCLNKNFYQLNDRKEERVHASANLLQCPPSAIPPNRAHNIEQPTILSALRSPSTRHLPLSTSPTSPSSAAPTTCSTTRRPSAIEVCADVGGSFVRSRIVPDLFDATPRHTLEVGLRYIENR